MQSPSRFRLPGKPSAIIVVLVCWFSAWPTVARAQGSPGQDAVYKSNGIVGSWSFIDASVFAGNVDNPNLCSVLNFVLAQVVQPTFPNGAVVDARGLPNSIPPTSMTCTISPWGSGSNYLNVPSTILLPATGGTTPNPIIIPNSSPWILPSNTHLIGEGDGTSGGSTSGTTIQAASGFSGTMIQFGSSSPVCPSSGCSGISVENLTLDGQGPLGQTVNGIANAYSQDGSYVDHVSLYQILGTRLAVSGTASNSGPYSNLTFDTGGDSRTSSTICASINA